MEQLFDTVIIGAGPSGMGCGIILQKNNKSVCVIDKAVFPRKKTCAGLVTGKTYELIKQLFDGGDIDGLFCRTSKTVRLFRSTELLAEAPMKNSARLVDRIDFDNALVERYKALGGRILKGERNIGIDHENNCVTLSNGDTVRYKNIVFADGALSMSHKLIKVDKRKMAFGVEVYVPFEQFSTDGIDLYFDCVKDGYIWAFPHGDAVCIGVAGLYDKRTDYKKILSDFLRALEIDPEGQQYVGAFLPYGYVVPQSKLPENMLLVGDAGGFTDPISGEGLYMALRTGMLAAEALSSGEPKKEYLNSVKPIVSIVEDGSKVQKLFFSSAVQKIFYKKVKGKTGLVSYFYDNMVDEYRYDYRSMTKLLSDYKTENNSS